MANKFSGNYFDGQSAKPRQIDVEIKPKRIVLSADGFTREIRETDLHNLEQVGENRLLIRFGKDNLEMLDIRSEEFLKSFRIEFPRAKSGKNVLEHIANSRWKGVAIILGLLVGLVCLVYFVVIPWTGDLAARHFPQKYEEELGATLYKNTIAEYTIDSAKTKLLRELIQKVDFQTTYTLDIVVVDYDMKNAFAMPGGHIVVFSGIMKDMKEYPELIGLLAHESSHVTKRHTLRSLFRSMSTYIFISAVLNDVSGLSAIVLQNADKIKSLSYSRKLEEEADMEGLQIMFHNKIDPNGMVHMFENMKKGNEQSNEMEFLSTHPVTESRIEYIQKKINESQFTVERNDTMQAVWEKLMN